MAFQGIATILEMIYTFYSFKGGVGRSMALANVAEVFLRRGLSVLVVDLDLEAPGIERYFAEPGAEFGLSAVLERPGLIDLLRSYRELRAFADSADPTGPSSEVTVEERIAHLPVEPLDRFIVPVYTQHPSGGSLSLITAGRRSGEQFNEYARQVLAFQWEQFFMRDDGELFFEWFRREAEKRAQVVLIDSRTGVTEMGGVCTYLLADAVVIFVATNQQNLEGSGRISESLRRRDLVEKGRHGRKLRQLIVPSRVDITEGTQLPGFQADFKHRFEAVLAENAARKDGDPFVELQVPYIPYYSFSERIAVRHKEHPLAHYLVGPFERLAAAMSAMAPVDSPLFQAYADPTRFWLNTAEEVVSALGDDQIEDAKRVLTRLVAVGDPAKGIPNAKIKIPVTAFHDALTPVLDRLTATSLLTRRTEQRDDGARIETVELPQQDLATSWPRLRQWINDDREFLTWRQQITIGLDKWEKSGQSADLLSGTLLDLARSWLDQRSRDLNERETAFLRQSIQFDKEKADTLSSSVGNAERSGRLLRRVLILGASLLALLVIASPYVLWRLGEKGRLDLAMAFHLAPQDYLRKNPSFLDDIRLNDAGAWESPGRWIDDAGWKAVPGVGGDPHDGALLVSGSSVGTPDLGSAVFYDFVAQFDISIIQGTKASWMIRVQKDGMQGYVFDLEQKPPDGIALHGWAVDSNGSRRELSEDGSVLNVHCCQPGEIYRVSVRAQGFSFKHTITAISFEASASASSTMVAEDSSSAFRYGNIGFLETNPASVTKVEYLSVQPLVIQ